MVKLALAVAARILRREAQMDPLLLTGAVRVALGQLGGSSEVRLRVPAAELELWTEAIALLPNLAVKPTVVAGEGMRLGECMIETKLGTVDLGIRAQLGEIERGFFDRAGAAGAARADSCAMDLRQRTQRAARRSDDSAARTLLRAAGARAALALARAGSRVGWPDHRVGGPAGLGGRVLRDSRTRRGARTRPR